MAVLVIRQTESWLVAQSLRRAPNPQAAAQYRTMAYSQPGHGPMHMHARIAQLRQVAGLWHRCTQLNSCKWWAGTHVLVRTALFAVELHVRACAPVRNPSGSVSLSLPSQATKLQRLWTVGLRHRTF